MAGPPASCPPTARTSGKSPARAPTRRWLSATGAPAATRQAPACRRPAALRPAMRPACISACPAAAPWSSPHRCVVPATCAYTVSLDAGRLQCAAGGPYLGATQQCTDGGGVGGQQDEGGDAQRWLLAASELVPGAFTLQVGWAGASPGRPCACAAAACCGSRPPLQCPPAAQLLELHRFAACCRAWRGQTLRRAPPAAASSASAPPACPTAPRWQPMPATPLLKTGLWCQRAGQAASTSAAW